MLYFGKTVEMALQELAPLAIGMDPMQVELLSQRLIRVGATLPVLSGPLPKEGESTSSGRATITARMMGCGPYGTTAVSRALTAT